MIIKGVPVSNSSSSSFMIWVKDGSELTNDKLLEIFGVSEEHILKPLVDGLVNTIVDCSDEITLDKFLKEQCYNTLEDLKKDDCYGSDFFDNESWRLYECSVSSECYEGYEATLYDMELHFDNENIKIIKYE